MPIYEYECKNCGKKIEIIQKFSDKPIKECPSCKKKTLKKIMSQTQAPIFKGTGFYCTDFKEN